MLERFQRGPKIHHHGNYPAGKISLPALPTPAHSITMRPISSTVGSGAPVPYFVHIPKNAGTDVENEVRKKHLPMFHDLMGAREAAKRFDCTASHVPTAVLSKSGKLRVQRNRGERFEDRTMFFAMRHPFERAVSQFLWHPLIWKHFGHEKAYEDMIS